MTSPTAHPQGLSKRVILLFIYIKNEVLDQMLIQIQNHIAYLEI